MLRTSEGGALKNNLDDCCFSCVTLTAGSSCSRWDLLNFSWGGLVPRNRT